MAENRHLFIITKLEFVGQLYFGEVVEVSAIFGFRAECAETFEFDVFSYDYAEARCPGFGVVQVFARAYDRSQRERSRIQRRHDLSSQR